MWSLQNIGEYRYHILGSVICVGALLVVTQKLIERHFRFEFRTSEHPEHLIILQHGFLAPWIQSYPLATFLCQIANQQSQQKASNNSENSNGGYLIQVMRANSSDYLFGFYSTCNGIKKGGTRTCNEIKSILKRYPSINKLSLIGSSLGGLYIREVTKQLYDAKNHCLYHELEAANFITLASPHLGVVHKINGCLVWVAKLLYFLCLLPKTVQELLQLDEAQILQQMASDNAYLRSLQLFENKVIYANTINDSRVSLSSGLILPSYEYTKDEDTFVSNVYLEDIEYSRSNKECVIREFSKLDGSGKFQRVFNELNDLWYQDFMDESMQWKRFVVSINTNIMAKYFAHELLSHPWPSFVDCQSVVKHLTAQFKW